MMRCTSNGSDRRVVVMTAAYCYKFGVDQVSGEDLGNVISVYIMLMWLAITIIRILLMVEVYSCMQMLYL